MVLMNSLPTYRRPARPELLRADRAQRCLAMLAAGLLALGLQLFAQVMPAEMMQGAMRGAMRASAAGLEEAQGFAATCLGFTSVPKGAPGGTDEKPADQHPSGQHPTCPVCFTLAQGQGVAAAAPDLALPADWPASAPQPVGLIGPAKVQLPPAFQPQAPPAVAVL